jgi:hypothetical protein
MPTPSRFPQSPPLLPIPSAPSPPGIPRPFSSPLGEAGDPRAACRGRLGGQLCQGWHPRSSRLRFLRRLLPIPPSSRPLLPISPPPLLPTLDPTIALELVAAPPFSSRLLILPPRGARRRAPGHRPASLLSRPLPPRIRRGAPGATLAAA